MRFALSLIFAWMLCGSAIAVTAGYLLKPGDVIEISVWQDEKLRRKTVILPDGKISFPLAGHMKAAGLTPEVLEKKIRKRLRKYFNDNVDVTVMVISVSDRVIYVTGQVRNPGTFTVKRPTTVLQAIALSGGLGPYAAKSRIQIRRKTDNDESFLEFNYNKFEKSGDLTGNIYLQDGDVVIVPERGLFN